MVDKRITSLLLLLGKLISLDSHDTHDSRLQSHLEIFVADSLSLPSPLRCFLYEGTDAHTMSQCKLFILLSFDHIKLYPF